MKTSDFDYHLPEDRIAQRPVDRGSSRLMVLDRRVGVVEHTTFDELPRFLSTDDVLLLNDTRVIAARMVAFRSTGRRFEILVLQADDGPRWQALLRPAARARIGEPLHLTDGGLAIPTERLDDVRWRVEFDPPLDVERLDRIGAPPLPPYIRRPEGALESDRHDYQTVYAANPGAVAAPTAGLHFTEEILDRIRAAGVELAFVTLHVGLGTFRPVQAELVANHRMHSEWYRFDEDAAAAVNGAIARGRRIVSVGTTSVRAMEGALAVGGGSVCPGEGTTDLFITPGFRFRGLGALVTNFHLPRSTLVMLVSAFAGRERLLDAYSEAIRDGYRFYSYGDAMLVV